MEIILTKRVGSKFINRGFLIGPYCPIYGVIALSIILLTKYFEVNILILFILITISVTFIEYITNYIMEKLFNVRWWDYSHMILNINGRICLLTSMFFGILGVVFYYYINPFITNTLQQMHNSSIIIISIFILLLFIIDIIISFKIVKKINISTKNIKKDNTEEVKAKIKEILIKKFTN